MKKLVLTTTIFILFFVSNSNAQDASVEKNVTGIQVGPTGIFVNHEFKLTNQLVLRGEAGLAAGYWAGAQYDGLGFLLTPVLRVEPRWYYNLNRRVAKSRDIKANSGNFVALQMSFYPDWFVIAKEDNITVFNQISIIPTWGIRRTLGKHFDYEAGIGIGYAYAFEKKIGIYTYEGDSGAVANIHLRIGYHF